MECNGNKIYLALGKNRQQNYDIFSWILQKMDNMTIHDREKICLVFLHAILPLKFIPTPMGNISVKQADEQKVKSFRDMQRTKIINENFGDLQRRCQLENIKHGWLIFETDDAPKGLVDLILQLGITKLVMGAASAKFACKKEKIIEWVRRQSPPSCQITVVWRESQRGSGTGNLAAALVPCESSEYTPNIEVPKRKKTINIPFTGLLSRKRGEGSRKEMSSSPSTELKLGLGQIYNVEEETVFQHPQMQGLLDYMDEDEFHSAHSTMTFDHKAGPSQSQSLKDPTPNADCMDHAITADKTCNKMQVEMLKRQLDQTMEDIELLRDAATQEKRRREVAEWTAEQLLTWGKEWEKEAMENGVMLKLLNELYELMKTKNTNISREREEAMMEASRKQMALRQVHHEVTGTLSWLQSYFINLHSFNSVENPSCSDMDDTNDSFSSGKSVK